MCIFFREPDVTATTLQRWVVEAVDGYTSVKPEHRKKCVRTIFAGDYEIDHPVYYKIDNQDYKIAVKDNGWETSDPKAMIDCFKKEKDTEGKIIRIIMYLKAWCDHNPKKMPSGLAMTILALNAKNKIVLNDRDDITLKDILIEIKKALDLKFECIVPALPNDDLFSDFDTAKKKHILDTLSDFITDAESALKEENQLKASKLWRRYLGNRFPEGEDKNEEKTIKKVAITTGASSSNPWLNE